MSLYLWSILLAIRVHILATPVPCLPAARLSTSQRVGMLPALRPIRQLHRGPHKLDRRQLALIHARSYGSTKLRDIYVPERHHQRLLSQHDHCGHLRTRECASHRRRRALGGGHTSCCYFCGAAKLEVGRQEHWVGHPTQWNYRHDLMMHKVMIILGVARREDHSWCGRTT